MDATNRDIVILILVTFFHGWTMELSRTSFTYNAYLSERIMRGWIKYKPDFLFIYRSLSEINEAAECVGGFCLGEGRMSLRVTNTYQSSIEPCISKRYIYLQSNASKNIKKFRGRRKTFRNFASIGLISSLRPGISITETNIRVNELIEVDLRRIDNIIEYYCKLLDKPKLAY